MPNTYQVGVNMVWGGNWSRTFSSIGTGLTDLSAKVGRLEKQFGNLQQILKGGSFFYGGLKAFNTLEKMVQAGGVLVTQQNKMRLAGDSNLRIAQDTTKAFEASARLQTISASNALDSMNRLRTMFGSGAGADRLLDTVVKAQTVLRTELGAGAGDQAWDLIQAARLRTGDAGEADRLVKVMMSGVQASGGAISGTAYQRILLTARDAGLNLSDDFLGAILPSTASQMATHGGMSAQMRGGMGQALANAYTHMFAQGMPVGAGATAGNTAYQLGLIGRMQGNKEILQGGSLFNKDPYEWVQKFLAPSLDQAHVTDPEHIKKIITQIAGNPVLAQLMTTWVMQGRAHMGADSPYEKARAARGDVPDLDASFKLLMDNDLATNMEAFNAQWSTMIEGFGSALVPVAIDMMQKINRYFLGPLGKFAHENPMVFQYIGEGIGVITLALMGAAGVALFAALGPVGWIAFGILALGGALLMFAPGIKGFFDWLVHLLEKFGVLTPPPQFGTGKNDNDTRIGASSGRYRHSPSGDAEPGNPGASSWSHPSRYPGRAAPGAAPWAQESRFGAWGDSGGSGTGSAYLVSQRAGMAAAARADPQLAAELRGVASTEDAYDPEGPIEALANRSAYLDSIGKHQSLHQLIHGGFYGPVNRGALPGAMAAIERNPALKAKLQAAIDKVWAGANRLKGATDQGSPGDPNAAWQGGRILPPGASRGAIYNDWGGGAGHAATAKFRIDQQQHVGTGVGPWTSGPWENGGAMDQRGGGLWPDSVPHPKHEDIIIHHTSLLDGRTVAKNTIKHMVSMGNHRSGSGVMADYSGVRPLSV